MRNVPKICLMVVLRACTIMSVKHRDKKLPNTKGGYGIKKKQVKELEEEWWVCTLCPSSMYNYFQEIVACKQSGGCHTEYNVSEGKRKKEKEKNFVKASFSLCKSSSHRYLLLPAFALITLSKDSLIGVLLTNTVK